MFIEQPKITGRLHIRHTGPDGTVLNEFDVPNLIVTAGLNWLAARMITAGIPGAMSHMAIGSGTTNPAAGDTALETELGRVALDSSGVVDNDTTYIATFPAGTGTGTVTEAGILNAGSGGTLLCRTEFGAITKASGDALVVTWVITIS